jgi:murein DD-endopeptidase MepM/ murein hydrolase activator NlpD
MHLQSGSLRVKAGDRVHKGQLLACIGASGDAREPHLHFEVTNSSKLLFGEGVPYVINHYRLNSPKNGSTEIHTNELPTDKEIVDFGQ